MAMGVLDRHHARRRMVENVGRLDKMEAEQKKAETNARIGIAGVLAEKKRLRSGFAEQGQSGYAEVDRIIKMEVIDPLDPQEIIGYTRQIILERAFQDGFRLFDEQANGTFQYEQIDGGFFPIGVGWGKTLLSLLIAEKAYQKGMRSMTLHLQSDTLSQLVSTDIPWARRVMPISYPIHVVGGKTMSERRSLCKSGKRGLYIFPYSTLSTADAEENLFKIRPELAICDEAHGLSNRDAARTQRFFRYIEAEDPELVAMSGTITRKRIGQYEHIIRQALKQYNPLPNSTQLTNEWGSVIDAEAGEVTSRSATGPIKPLIWWAMKTFPGEKISEDQAGFRKAFKLRLNSAPGVVASGDNEIGTSLTLTNREIKEYAKGDDYERLQELIKQVEQEWVTPNGDEIEHAIHTWKWNYELSAGFYNELVWPEPDVLAKRRSISSDQAVEQLEQAKEAHEARQEYSRELRDWLDSHSKQGLDTPLLVGSNMSNNGSKNVGTHLYQAWSQWKALAVDGLPERDSNAVRVCDYKIRAAVDWARDQDGGIGWIYHQEIGRWLYEALIEDGQDALHCPAGGKYNDLVRDPANRNQIVVASWSAHGTGKNLQHHQNNYVVQWPRQADKAEQLLGRTHRNGQTADELRVARGDHTEFDYINFAACLNDSLYIHQTTGTRQKMIYCNYDPLPKIFPSSVLRERGAEVRRLTLEQQKMMKDKFGDYE